MTELDTKEYVEGNMVKKIPNAEMTRVGGAWEDRQGVPIRPGEH